MTNDSPVDLRTPAQRSAPAVPAFSLFVVPSGTRSPRSALPARAGDPVAAAGPSPDTGPIPDIGPGAAHAQLLSQTQPQARARARTEAEPIPPLRRPQEESPRPSGTMPARARPLPGAWEMVRDPGPRLPAPVDTRAAAGIATADRRASAGAHPARLAMGRP